jgi:hypothetical protein
MTEYLPMTTTTIDNQQSDQSSLLKAKEQSGYRIPLNFSKELE